MLKTLHGFGHALLSVDEHVRYRMLATWQEGQFWEYERFKTDVEHRAPFLLL